jgi:hypothetical protein
MSNYLEEAAAALREAVRNANGVVSLSEMAELHLRVADGFTRLAAIERGLLPPEMAPVPAGDSRDL